MHTYTYIHINTLTHGHTHTFTHTEHSTQRKKTLYKTWQGSLEAEVRSFLEVWSLQSFWGSSFSNLRLVSLNQDKEANRATSSYRTNPGLSLTFFDGTQEGVYWPEKNSTRFLSQVRRVRKKAVILEIHHSYYLVLALSLSACLSENQTASPSCLFLF